MDELDLGATIRGFISGQKLFGRYTLIRQLGRGGMGVVWRARDESLERDVAIKMLPEMVANDPASVRELKRETSRNQQLSHPHILRVYDFAEGAGLCGITMEIAEGGTLTSRRLDQPGEVFAPAQLGPWVRQLCEALDYAHQRGKVVHRDLKPANLMLTADDELKVTDFGIAASLSESVTRVSKQAGTSGTPVYMSPQQMMGDKPAVTDDIYALGATLYELLTGKPPFYAGNILLQVQSKTAPSLAERRQELGRDGGTIPPEWEQAIAACLAKDPKDRPQCAGEVAERLGLTAPRTGAGVATAKRAEPDAPQRPTPARGDRPASRAPLYAALAATVIVLGGLGWYFGIHAPAQEARAAESRKQQGARQKAADEKARYDALLGRINAVTDFTSQDQMADLQAAVDRFAASAPDSERVSILALWSQKQAAWETARKAREQSDRAAAETRAREEQQRRDAERLANARGGIVVRTNPSGAEVRIGAIALEKSPLTLKEQKLGKYPVRVRLDGYDDWMGEAEVRENEFAELDVALVRSTGTVVLSGPPGAEVTAGGTRVGTLPLTLERVPTGPVRYRVTLRGFRSAEVAGEVARNTELRLSADLTKQTSPQPDQPWENTLGQKFLPVSGTSVLFGVWETRERDFAAFVRATGRNWSSANAGDDYPAVNLNWDEAKAFCQWLTEKERREGVLRPDQSYRLPTDAEWSIAVGLQEPADGTPASKSAAKAQGQYPWGTTWPPPPGVGNYADETYKKESPRRFTGSIVIDGYDDGYAGTAPVGSFSANRFGLYDLGGNVFEWVEDAWDRSSFGGGRLNVVRDASFYTAGFNYLLLSASRSNYYQASSSNDRDEGVGFRVVLDAGRTGTSSAHAAGKAGRPAAGQKWTVQDLQLDLMPIAPGTFQMGSVSGGDRDERPATQVTLTQPFWLGRTEVTNAQWTAVMGYVAGLEPNLPAASVMWTEAMAFCQRLTDRERAAGRLPAGFTFTLPTEAQWEYACRAGTSGDYAGDLDAMGWHGGNSGGRMQPVATKRPNAWGLHDMHGSVGEWCLDAFGKYPGGSVVDPTGPASGSGRVFRGGHAATKTQYLRSASRAWHKPDYRMPTLGFRVALVATPAALATASAHAEAPGASAAKITVAVSGQVKNPARLTLEAGADLIAAIQAAGGVTPMAQPKRIRLSRTAADGSTTTREFDIDALLRTREGVPTLADGDVIFVPERLI